MPTAAASGSGRSGFLVGIELVLLLIGLVMAVVAELIDRRRSPLVSAAGAVFLCIGMALVLTGL